ncbi:zinc finger CCHC domain-containing protein [Pimephales promelas]|nr:zinc finger CCHC domain-containing protein [Pimephales promelas]
MRLIPKFDEKEVERFFLLFERVADAQRWPDEERTLMLQSVFTGRAQEAYSSLSVEDASDYQAVKAAVLRAYELVPEAYRQRFRSWKRDRVERISEESHGEGEVEVAVRSCLPVEGIQVILGNDLAGDRVWQNDSPHLVVTSCPVVLKPDGGESLNCAGLLPTCVITRSMSKTQVEEKHESKKVKEMLEVPSILSVSRDELVEKQKSDSTLGELFDRVVSCDTIENLSSGYYLDGGLLVRKWVPQAEFALGDPVVQVDWESGLPWLMMAAREAAQESTGFSPNELVFGHDVRSPLSVLSADWEKSDPPKNVLSYVSDFRRRIYEACHLAKSSLRKSQDRMKSLFDRRTELRSFQPGDQVLALLPVVGSPFQAKFVGPYTVAHSSVNDDRIELVSTPVTVEEDLIEHDIDVGGANPIRQRYYRVSANKRKQLDDEIEYMLKNGIAEPSFSSWASTSLLVSKPDGSFRFCTDYRKGGCVTRLRLSPLLSTGGRGWETCQENIMGTPREEIPVPTTMVRLKNTARLQVKKEAETKRRFGRDFVVVELLRGIFGVPASLIFCLQDFFSSGFMDLTFFQLKDCVTFFEDWENKKDIQLLRGLHLHPAFAQDYLPLVIHLYNPFVEDGDVLTFLARYCEAVKGGEQLKDHHGIWMGKRRYLVKLRADPTAPGGLIHPPVSFFIGSNRGFLHYPGQPLYCRRCGARGPVKTDCAGQRCRLCESTDHIASACPEPKKCSQCGRVHHLFRDCPTRKKSFASLFKEGQDLQADLEALLTILPVEMESQEAGPSNANSGASDPKGCVDEGMVNSREQVRGEDGGQQLTTSQEWSEIDVAEVFSGIFEESGKPALSPLGTSARPSPSEGGDNCLQEDVPMSKEMEVGQGQRLRRFTETGDMKGSPSTLG